MEKLKCKVVMLPTEKAVPNIILLRNTGEYQLFDQKFYDMFMFHQQFGDFAPTNAKYQHLYFTSNREIQIDDCFIGITPEETWHVITPKNKSNFFGSGTFVIVRKIEATTDLSLGIKQLIHQSFVEVYVKKKGKIDEVMIDMDHWSVGKVDEPNKLELRPKLRPDNTVIVSKIKDTWTRDEVEILCRKALEEYAFASVSTQPYNPEEFEIQANEWINNNL